MTPLRPARNRLLACLVAAVLTGLLSLGGGVTATSTDRAPVTDDLLQRDALGATADCSIPCGRISPILSLSTEIPLPIKVSDIPNLPETSTLSLRMYWDMEQEGPGAADDGEMTITTTISTRPDWLDVKVEPSTCTVTIVPGDAEYDVCDMTLTLAVKEVPVTHADLEAPNHRVMLFVISEETGTFAQSYGVKDMRFKDDGTLLADPTIQVEEAAGPGLALALMSGAGLVVVAVAAFTRRS